MAPWMLSSPIPPALGEISFDLFSCSSPVPPLASPSRLRDVVGRLIMDFPTASRLDFTAHLRIFDFLVMTDYFPFLLPKD